jgi:iron complex transport system ATP-binding protein
MRPSNGISTPVLELEKVEFAYGSGGKQALRSLSASIPGGEAVAILGPNGAGKTTLLHLALGYLAPRSGRVLFEGQALSSYSRRELGSSIALVPQSERIPFQYTVLEYVTMGRAPYLSPLESPGPEDIRIASEAVEAAGIAELAGRDITTLSGGERQLASIARAIAQGARLMLLDEPMSHLDLANKSRVLDLACGLVAKGTTVVFTTHEPEVAAAAASYLVLMREGRVLEAGPLESTMSGENLSATYGLPVRVESFEGRTIVLWTKGRDGRSDGR